MADFERLNRETQTWRNGFVTRDIYKADSPVTFSQQFAARYNNDTFKQNNGQYSNYYTYR